VLRVLQLSGHGDKKWGFIWNADAAANERQVVDVGVIALAIGSVAGRKGPLEFVSLNGCSTNDKGLALRKHGVPHVLCWRTPVQDTIARLLIAFLYRSLVEQQGGSRDYRAAFQAAVAELMGWLEEDDYELERNESMDWKGADEDLALNETGTVNMVQFLSHGGDSQEICLPVATRQEENQEEEEEQQQQGEGEPTNAQMGQVLSLGAEIAGGVGVGLLLVSLFAARKR
jgi:hypothetical protein